MALPGVTNFGGLTSPAELSDLDTSFQAVQDAYGGTGPTSSRPSSPFLMQPYFDTTINQMIWCTNTIGPVWSNASGTSGL